MSAEGDIKAYFKTIKEDKSGTQLFDETSHKMIDDDLMLEFIPRTGFQKIKILCEGK